MDVLFTILFILVFIWLGISFIMFVSNCVKWFVDKSLKKQYQSYVDEGDSWYMKPVREHDDEMIKASRGMVKSFTWPLRIFVGANGMLSYGRKKTSAEIKQEKKFLRELEESVAKEKAKQMSEWEREFKRNA